MDARELHEEVESSDAAAEPPTGELKPKKKKKERGDDDVKPLRGEQKKKFVEWIGRHADNLYPSREEKLGLAKQLNASYIQVTRLLANHRRRLQVQKKRRSPDEAANSSDKENQRAGGSEPPDDRLGHLNSVIDECSRLPPADDERLEGSGRDEHESNQFHCDERLDEADEQHGGREASARHLRIDEAIEATRERVRLLPADFDLDELLAVGAGAEMDGNYVTPPPSVHPPALPTENPNGNPQISPPAAPPAAAPLIPQSTPKSVDPAASMGVDANQHATAAYHQHLLNLNSILQQQQQQLGERSTAAAAQQAPVHVHPILQSFCKPPSAEGESGAPAIEQQQPPAATTANTRPQLALNQLIGNQSTAASVPEIAPAAPLQTTADSTVAAASASTSASAASTSSTSASSMLFPQAFNGMQGVPVHSPQWMAAFQLLQQHQAAAVAAQQHAGGAPPNEQHLMNIHQVLALRDQQQQLGGPAFTTALAELQNRQQQLQAAAANGAAKTAASTASTSATPLTPDHVGDGEFGRSLEQKFAAPTAETLNLLNDGRHPNWMSPPLSSHTPASSASPMLFAGEDNAEGRLPSTGGAGGPLGSTLLSVDNEPAFSDISSTCSGSPPPADFAPLPTITSGDTALLNGDSSVFTTPPTPADSKAEKPPKKRRQSKKAATAVEVDVEVVDDAAPPTTPVTSRKRVSVGGAAKPRESAAAKRARLAAGQPDGGVRKAPKKPKVKRATIPSTLIVPRAFHELNENESIAVRVLAGLAHGVYH
ncbi:Homeobox domain-containing protein [Aphelenchoides fujianensis]|nr:Homeobox domain-containing protein [Aphelenchoides fujianensis]